MFRRQDLRFFLSFGFFAVLLGGFAFAQDSVVSPESVPTSDVTEATSEATSEPTYNMESYSRLAHASVAQRMGLDDAQRTKVQTIMTEYAQLLAKAPRDQWKALAAENEKKLEAVLTPVQKANWLKVINEKTIRFTFKYQSWADVLQWFAEQVGMQLIMDAPPLGTFNYTDPNDYTPTEALDKINGILQTYGYTLLRNDQMLILFNLERMKRNNGLIPAQYVPKIQPDDLPNRGKFEYVAVTFSLGRRDSANIQTAMKPFLGSYNQIVPLPGNALLITDTAGTLQVIDKIITSIQEPEAPKPEEKAPPAYWETYKIEKTNPQRIEEIIKSFLPGIPTVLTPNSDQILVLAQPDQQAQIKQVVERLDVDAGEMVIPVVRVYSFEDIGDVSPTQIFRMWQMTGMYVNPVFMEPEFIQQFIETVQKVAPNAILTYDTGLKKLVALAVPAEQENIKSLISELKSSPSGEDELIFKFYKFTNNLKRISEEITETMKALVPKAMVKADNVSNRFFVIANAEDHKRIAEAFSELESGILNDEHKKIVCYPVTMDQLSRFSQLFSQLKEMPEFEGVEEVYEGRLNQLTIWATPEQHEQVRKILHELAGGGEAEESGGTGTLVYKMKAFPLRRGDAYSYYYLLPQIVPGITVVADPTTNSVVVYGTEKALADIGDFFQKLETDIGMDVLILPLNEELPFQVMETLQQKMTNSGQLIFDKENMRLLAYGVPADLEMVEKMVNQITVTDVRPERSIHVQSVARDFPDHVVDFIRKTFPRADIQYDRFNKYFTVAATKSDQLLCAKLIGETELSLLPEDELRFYAQDQVVSDKMIDLLRAEVKLAAEINRDDQNPMVLKVKARPVIHEQVRKILERIKTDLPSSDSKELHCYPMTTTERKRFDLVRDDLFKEIGNFRIMTDDRQNMLSIWALPAQHEKIAAALEGLRERVPSELQDSVITYSLKFSDFETVHTLLDELYPDIKITDDKAQGRLIIRVPKQHVEAIQLLLQQLDTPDPDRAKRFYATYPLGSVYTYDAVGNYRSPSVLVQELQSQIPNAKVSYDYINAMIVVWGTEEEQQMIAEMVNRVYNAEPSEKFGRFPIRRADVSTVINTIGRLYPAVPVSYDPAGKTLIVEAANSAQLKKIAALMEKLDPVERGPNDLEVRFYQLRAELSPEVLATLRSLVSSEAQLVSNTENHQLMVLARPAEHDLIKKNVDSIISTFIPEDPMHFIYNVTDDQRKRIEAFIDTASKELTGLKIIKDDTPGQVSIWARPSEHQLIADVLLQMQSNQGTDAEIQLRSFSLTTVDKETVEKALNTSVPEARTIFDDQGSRLLVWATKPNMAKVIELIQQFDPNSTKNLKLQVYPIAIGDPKTIDESIKQVYPNIKSSIDTRNKRIMIWATPEEHAAIAEMIEQVNKDANIPLQEKYKSYPTPRTYYYSVMSMLQALFPEAEVFSDQYAQHVTVRALAKEHEQIEALIKQMQSSDNQFYSQFAAYPLGNADPLTIEAMLQGMFPEAASLTAPQIVDLINPDMSPYSRQILRMQRQSYATGNMRTLGLSGSLEKGCFKVDPQTKSVMLFLPDDELKRASAAIESIIMMSQMSGSASVKPYVIKRGHTPEIEPFIARIAPMARIQFMENGNFIVYATDTDHEKIDALVNEYNELEREGVRGAPNVLLVPDGSSVNRDTLLTVINQNREKMRIYAYEGPQPNQIIVYARPLELDMVKKLIAETCQTVAEPGSFKYDVYLLKHITLDEAISWLKRIVPNAYIDPGILETAPTARRLVVRGTETDHEIIAAALEKLDVDLPPEVKPVPREYSFPEDFPYIIFYCYRALYSQFPNAVFAFDRDFDDRVLMVVASPADHDAIEKFINKYIEEKKKNSPYLEFYVLEKSNVHHMQMILQYALSYRATIVPGVALNQLIVYANAHDQEKVLEIIAKSEKMTLPEGVGPTIKMYPVPAEKCVTLASLLHANLPGSIIFPIPSEGYILVYATEDEHKIVEEMSHSVAEAFPEPTTKLYFAKYIPIGEAYTYISQLYAARAAAIQLRTDTGDLLVTASDEVHGLIQKTMDQIDVVRPEGTEKIPVTYDIGELTLNQRSWAFSSLIGAFPSVSGNIFHSTDYAHWVIYAKPYEQQKIKTLIDEMLTKSPKMSYSLETYTLQKTTATAAWTQVITFITPYAQPGYFSSDPHKFFVWAKKSDHEKIKNAVDKMNADDSEMTVAKPYRFQNVTLASAHTVISTHFPGVTIASDTAGNLLLITATSEEHKKIEEIASALDKDDPTTQVSLRIHPTGNISTTNLTSSLSMLYASYPLFQAQPDPYNNALVAIATPQQHKFIDSVIQQIQAGGLTDPNLLFQTYDFKNVNFYAFRSIIYWIFTERGFKADIIPDYYNDKIIVRATPQEHQLITQVVDSCRIEEREMEVFVLNVIDPEDVQLAISTLFLNESYVQRPRVNINAYSNQVYVNGTKAQIEKIRTKLVEMGETGLAVPRPGAVVPPTTNIGNTGSSTIRTLHLEGADSQKLVEEIRKLWPQVNSQKNPLIIRESAPPSQENKKESESGHQPDQENPRKTESPTSFFQWAPQGFCAEEGLTGTEGPVAWETTSENRMSQEGAPVYLSINEDGSLNIASMDTKALDQLENILERTNSRVVFEGRDYAYYTIRNTTPSMLYPKLQMMISNRFRGQSTQYDMFGYPIIRTQPTITPDDPTNTIFVQATRSMRKEIEQMIAMLDVPDPVIKPLKIKINNADPAQVLQQIQRVYWRQLYMTRLPGGAPVQLSLNRIDNSIDVIATDELGKALAEYAKEIDTKAAEDESRKIHVVPLKEINSTVLMEVLGRLYPSSRQSYGGYYTVPLYTPYGGYNTPYPYGRRGYY